MKKALFTLVFLSLLAFSASAQAGSQLDSLFKVTVIDGKVMYVHPTDNSATENWGGVGINIDSLKEFDTKFDADGDFNGATNTKAIVAQLGDNGGRAYPTKVCEDLVAYGFDNWYLPAAGELNQMYLQLGPNGSRQITQGSYWSSTESTGANRKMVWGKMFNDGYPFTQGKGFYNRCRCVRR